MIVSESTSDGSTDESTTEDGEDEESTTREESTTVEVSQFLIKEIS